MIRSTGKNKFVTIVAWFIVPTVHGSLSKGNGTTIYMSQVNQSINTTTLRPETETMPYFCIPFIEPTPDFSKPGKRISEEKCEEYIWELNVRLEKKRLKSICQFYQLRKKNMFPTVMPFNPSEYGDYPHMGAIGWKASNGTWVFKCGSSLISEKFVLTAAHCAKASPNDPTISDPIPKIVRLGDKNILDKPYSWWYPNDFNISRIIVHPQYSSPKKYFDIALMELENTVTFSRLLHPACLWSFLSTSKIANYTVTGWGVVESGSLQISPELSHATVDVFDSKQCDDLLKNSWNRNWCGMKDHQICAGKLAGGVDACQGDSGGPLQVKIIQRTTSEGQMHYVFGIISFGVGCARPNLPGLYTRVASFIDWIEDNVWGDGEIDRIQFRD